MSVKRIVFLFLCLLAAKSVSADVLVAAKGAFEVDPRDFHARLDASDLIYVGEDHDNAWHHLVQLDTLKTVFARRTRVFLGLEMVDITQQDALDRYVQGAMTESEFKKFWEENWNYYELYEPLLDFARDNRIPMKALNIPRSIVRQVGKGGLNSLTPEQRKMLPPVIYPIKSQPYLEYLKKALDHGNMDPGRLARLIEAQTVWNESMAAHLIQFQAAGVPLVVIAGSGHMIHKAGIMESIQNRKALKQVYVQPYPEDKDDTRSFNELLSEIRSYDSQGLELTDFFHLKR